MDFPRPHNPRIRLKIKAKISVKKLPSLALPRNISWNSKSPQMGSKWFEYSPESLLHAFWEPILLDIPQELAYCYSPTLTYFSDMHCHHCQKQQIPHCCWCLPVLKALATMSNYSVAKRLRTWAIGSDGSKLKSYLCLYQLCDFKKVA